jgi:glycosyltransferase involved in cell wall biosynthesis
MKVVYFTRAYGPHDRRFVQALAETQEEVTFLSLERGGTDGPPGEDRRVRWEEDLLRGRKWSWRILPTLTARLAAVLRRLHPDLVHAGPIQQCALLTALAGYRPLVSMSWGSDLLLGARRGLGRWAAAFALWRTDVLVCDSQTVRRTAQGLGMKDGRIVVFPWGVDLERFQPGRPGAARRQLGWERAIVLISVRAWEPLYGVEEVVEAFARGARSDSRLRLLLLGDGSRREAIRTAVARSRLEDRVHMPGWIPGERLPDYYNSADVYVTASRSDGSSVSLLEAMASGLPCVGSDIPGNREWIAPGETGFLYPVGEPALLEREVRRLSAEAGMREALGRRARGIVQARADWRRSVQALQLAYQRALDSRSERTG